MRVWRNRSYRAYCCYCNKRIKIGEPCVLIATHRYLHFSRSTYLHIHCVDEFIKALKKEVNDNVSKILKWRLEQKG